MLHRVSHGGPVRCTTLRFAALVGKTSMAGKWCMSPSRYGATSLGVSPSGGVAAVFSAAWPGHLTRTFNWNCNNPCSVSFVWQGKRHERFFPKWSVGTLEQKIYRVTPRRVTHLFETNNPQTIPLLKNATNILIGRFPTGFAKKSLIPSLWMPIWITMCLAKSQFLMQKIHWNLTKFI